MSRSSTSSLAPGEYTINVRVVALLVLSVSMVSSASILISSSSSSPLVIVFWRTIVASAIMFSIGAVRGDHRRFVVRDKSRDLLWIVLIGVVLSFHFCTWFSSLLPPFRTTVAASVVLVNTSPIFTGLLSTLFLGESLSRRSWTGVLIAMSGSVMLVWNDLVYYGMGALSGDILALIGGIFLAIYFTGGRRIAVRAPITVYTGTVYLSAAVTTLLLCVLVGEDVVKSVLDPREALIFIALALFPTVLGHSVNNYLLTLVPAYVVSSAVLGEPVGATILAIIFLGQVPAPETVVSFLVILAGIALVLSGQREQSTP
ncbi:MAG: DMT family transporter [Candidatus Thorarchaeota archaeon]